MFIYDKYRYTLTLAFFEIMSKIEQKIYTWVQQREVDCQSSAGESRWDRWDWCTVGLLLHSGCDGSKSSLMMRVHHSNSLLTVFSLLIRKGFRPVWTWCSNVPGVAMDPSRGSVGGRQEAGKQGAGGHAHQRGSDGAQGLNSLCEVSRYSLYTMTTTKKIDSMQHKFIGSRGWHLFRSPTSHRNSAGFPLDGSQIHL